MAMNIIKAAATSTLLLALMGFAEPTCRPDEFDCGFGECIPGASYCNGRTECRNGIDEANCTRGDSRCRADEFTCANHEQCVPIAKRCDLIHDCSDLSDERNCPCKPTDFHCHNSFCIPHSQRCDGIRNCQDGSDELECATCEPYQWRCHDGTCIDQLYRCNMKPDCPDGSDESAGCSKCAHDQFRCNDGVCLSLSKVCDGVDDCTHSEDEESCSNVICTSGQFTCASGQCVPESAKCNGHQDCYDNTDESNCNKGLCPHGEFQCDEGFCIMGYKQCNGIADCPSESDEWNCPPSIFTIPTDPLSSECAAGEIRCQDGTCTQGAPCDGYIDCPDRSDEQNCTGVCTAGQFRCANGACIDERLRCDGYPDCRDSSDEHNCGLECPSNQIPCQSGVLCVDSNRRCDGYADCSDASDERDCHPTNGSSTFEKPCGDDEFNCGDQQCVDDSYRCDGLKDCKNGRDEEGCECDDTQFQCKSDNSCIDIERRCDGTSDCADNSDERDCSPTAPPIGYCARDELKCEDGTCIPTFRQCDGRPDCPDGTDERGCPCRNDQFPCLDGSRCIDSRRRCDRWRDCSDGSDEADCPTSPPSYSTPEPTTPTPPGISCQPGYRPCKRVRQCIRADQLCDGTADCSDFSDEDGCPYNRERLDLHTYPDAQEQKERQEVVFTCRDEGPLRVRVHWERENGLPLPPGSTDVNGRLEMPNIQLEHQGTYLCVAEGYPKGTPGADATVQLKVSRRIPPPSLRPPSACGLFDATCANGDCIPKNKVCDGHFDCGDGSDENRCNPSGCEPNEFQCQNKKCVLKTWRCDSDDDCGDGSDEEGCTGVQPGSLCGAHQFQCRSGNQCIPRSYHCDIEKDCVDGSDEIGCVKPVVYRPPPPMVNLVVGDRFEINCTAVGVPTPLIVWRLNWRHVPAKCRSHSENGVGTLVCDNIQVEDQGAYSCEAINIKGMTFAHPDTILMVTRDSLCRPGYFNVQARNERECIKCFCFGQTSTCRSADLFIYQFQPPFDSLKLLGVRVDPIQGIVDIRDEPIYRGNQPDLTAAGAKGVHAAGPDSSELNQPDVWPYFAMPENYHGNQLKSYGGYLRYSVSHSNRGYPSPGPDVIISGNGYILQHQSRKTPAPYQDDNFEVRFFEGEWYKKSPSTPESVATREEIMMVLEDIDNILIKLQYNSGVLNTTLTNIAMDSAATPDSGLGPASYVEDCSCPAGYTGSSCERCSEGFTRRKAGPWLGQCLKEQPSCPPGMYNDGRECQICPCPHTNPSNQFGRTCHLGSDGDVVCDCPPGYVGNRCQQCAEGYIGNPLIPGDSCVPDRKPEPYCDLSGALDTRLDPYGRCRCKDLTEGPSCNQCKANTFHLSGKNQFGCISCFCMGVSMQCASSNWYRDKITTYFTSSINNFKIIDNLNREYPITEGISLNQQDQAISYSGFSSPNAYYWSLPSLYLGNKITSYGGSLRYTLKHSPVPGGQSSRNVAADVELISRNNINLLYYNRNQSYPTNAPQTFVVPLLEQYWQRSDGQQADREHLLMVLADLENIYIKATYYTQTSVSSLISVELDTATDRNTGSTERALEVEQCHCPPGYTGLSCEDCDVGYSRTTKGLYLGTCEQCNCNGHSNECDAESGICLNCRDHTTGDNCELCLPGYEGSPTTGGICTYTGTEIPCSCDPRGSVSSECYGGRCRCKTNVEGNNCDRCRSGTFGLSMNNIDGCEMCFCFGEATQCSESNLYIEQIPIQILPENHGFTITDQLFGRRVSTNFSMDMFRNEISYPVPPGTRDTLYWSLPSIFTGNKVKSYGGQLEFVQRYTQYPSGRYIPNKDVIINGNGKTIYWSHPGELRPDVENSVSVQLHPSARWFVILSNMPGSPISRTYRIDGSYGTKPASREDILMVLANVDSILIRASPSSDTRVSYLSDITLDTAVDTDTGKPRASSIEVCRCPPGYRGTSCESCASGYYKDYYFDNLKPLGTCQRCPCNDREEGCEMGPDRRVMCHCRPGYTGVNCEQEGTLIKVDMEIHPPTVVAPIGTQVKFSCKFLSEEYSGLNITVEGLNLYNFETVGNETTFYHVVGCFQQQVRCVARNRLNQEVGYVSAVVYPAGISTTPYPEVNPTYAAPTIDITIEDHHIGIYEVGSTVRYTCSAKSQYSPRTVQVHWSKDGSNLPSRAIDDGRGLLVITNLKVTDSGRYICEASDGYTIATSSVNLNVGVKEDERPRIAISEPYVELDEGRPVDIRCVASGVPAPELSLTRLDGQPLDRRYFTNGVFHIPYARESDSGTYQCIATNRAGSDHGQFQVVVRRPNVGQHTNLVRVDIVPPYFTGMSGDTIRMNCSAPVNVNWIRWSKQSGNLPYNYQEDRGGLIIPNASPDASGVYICTVMSSQGTSNTSSATVSIRGSDISEYPTAKVSPNRITLQQGQATELNCMATGRPTPTVKWTKLNGELARNIEQQGPVLYIRNARVEDRGIYVCVATNGKGIAQSSVVVEVTALEMPRLEIHPSSSQTVVAGGSAIVQCRVMEGRPSPTVTWRRADNRPMSRNVEEMSGGTLRFMDVNVGDQGEYICTATNEAGTVTASHHLVVHTAPEVQITPTQDTISRPEGEYLRLICQATGTPQPTVQWSKYGGVSGYRTDNSVNIPNVAYQEFNRLSRDDQGVYVCRAESSAGIVENRIQLIIEPRRGDGGDDATHPAGHWKDNEPNGPNSSQPEYDDVFKAAVGARAEIRCSIKDVQGSRIDISWIRTDNTSLQRNAYERSGTLYIENVQPSDAGVYRCLGIDQNTRKVVFGFNTYLKVLFPPRITLIPPRQVVHPGEDAYINCSSTGEQPIQTWWEAVGRTMPTSVFTREGHLRFNNIQLSDTGRYLCRARNNAGEAEAVADVIVEENISKPAITAEQKQQDAPLGSNVRLGCRTAGDRKTIRWYRQNQPLPQNSQVADQVLFIPNVQYQDQGRYFCELSTKEGAVSDYIDLQVSRHVSSMTAPLNCPREWYRCRNGVNCIPPEKMCDYSDDCGDNSDEDDCKPRIRRRGPYSAPSLYITPPDSDLPHRPGSNVDIACQSSERGAITTWSKPSGWMLDNVRLQGGRMRIDRIRQDNAGVYRCEATGQQGVYHKDYQLRVADEEVKDEPPLEVKSVPRGSNVVLECKTKFNSPNSYKWSKQGGTLPNYIDIYSSTLQLNDVGSTDAGTYTCTATSGSRTIDVPFILVVTGIVPHFAQAPNSYITLPTLMDSYIQFAFEISFKPENGNGLILYNGNRGSEKNGDFISLLLVDSVPEFKFNLGSGTATLQADRPLSNQQWHTIKVVRNRKKATMFVDGEGPFISVADGKYIGLDLTEPLYLGGVPNPNNISPDVFTYSRYIGFVGCISQLKIGHNHVDIMREALNKTGLTSCETCSEDKCENKGACQEALTKEGFTCICPSGFSGATCNKLKGEACSPYACGVGRCIDLENTFTCECPLGRAGRRCEREITVNEPAFQNDAYIAYPTPKPNRRLKITLKVKPNSHDDGLLLYCGETEEGHGDFVSLAIKDGGVEFRFDAGNGPVVIRHREELQPGKWHALTASRSLSDARLLVDGRTPVVEKLSGNHKTLNLQTSLYVGGYDKHHIKLNNGVQVFRGFDGCISTINIGTADINVISNATDASNVIDCSEFSPDEADVDNNIYSSEFDSTQPKSSDLHRTGCSGDPCKNGGQCYPLSPMEYRCSCLTGYTGNNCETEMYICDQRPCQNQGVCKGNNTHYSCDCPLGYTGYNCEQVTELQSDAHFDGDGYLEFSRNLLDHQGENEEVIALEFSTNSSNGLIFWHGQTPNEDGQGQDYISLTLQNGYLQYSFDLGQGAAIIQNRQVRVDNGERHNVILKRRGRRGTMDLDNTWMEEGDAEGYTTDMDCKGNIYIGGTPNIPLMTSSRVAQGFTGCIHAFELQNSQRLDLGMKAINGLNVKPCSSYADAYSNELVN